MNWRERMDSGITLDAADEKALEKFNEWVDMAQGDFTREDCIRKGYDPEILNEFCFYPMKYWGRLIEWASKAPDEYEPSYQFKMIRAAYILTKVDPAIIQFVQRESQLDASHEGPSFVLQQETSDISPEGEKLLRKLDGMESVLEQLNGLDFDFGLSDEDMADMEALLSSMEDGKMMF